MRRLCAIVRCVFVVILTTVSALAQTASLTGRVTDPQGAVVVGAAVTLTAVTGNARTTRTRQDGSFAFEPLSDGDYTLQVESPGFATVRQRVSIAGGTRTLDIPLSVAGLVEDVSVTAAGTTRLPRPTVTGTRLGLTLLETPASVQVITGEEVRERGDTTVAEAKSRAVGVVTQANPGNGGGAVSARGFGGVGSVMQSV